MRHKTNGRHRPNLCVLGGKPTPPGLREAFRRLYRRLLVLHEHEGLKTFAITSAHVGEGKTLLSINLALTVAEDPSTRVVLLDFDFRMPQVHKYLGIDASQGLGEVVRGKVELVDAMVPGPGGGDNLRVLPAGKLDMDISPELYRKRIPPVLEALKASEDVLILDTPPILPIADHDFLADLVDAVFLVVRPEVTRRSLLEAALESMQDKRIRGIVVNGVSKQGSEYYYYKYE